MATEAAKLALAIRAIWKEANELKAHRACPAPGVPDRRRCACPSREAGTHGRRSGPYHATASPRLAQERDAAWFKFHSPVMIYGKRRGDSAQRADS